VEKRNDFKKQQQTAGGNQAVNTAFGVTGPDALHLISGRDTGQCKKAWEQKVQGVGAERKAIEMTLQHLKERRYHCDLAAEQVAREYEQQQQATQQQQPTRPTSAATNIAAATRQPNSIHSIGRMMGSMTNK
jgi:hypothetical protein